MTDDKRKKKKERKGGGKRALLECFTSICTIMRVSEREGGGNLFVRKEQSFGFEGFATGRNNKRLPKVNVFAWGGKYVRGP